ncbi:pre-rRNA-processing protein pno1 [Glugoides intestinalis]
MAVVDDLTHYRSIPIPENKIRLLKQEWLKVYTPIVQLGKLQLRFNHRTKHVEIKACDTTTDLAFLERSITYIQAILDGFKAEDAVTIMKFKDIFTESFNIQDIRKLKNSHLSRAIGRIIGRDGRIKESIENFSKCKFILRGERISLMGCEENIRIAKDAIGRLVQGSEPTSIFNRLRIISTKLKDKYGSIQTFYDDLRPQ